MQLQSLFLTIFMLIIIPIMILSSNHNVFYVLMGLALFITSFKNIHYQIFDSNDYYLEDSDNSTEDIEAELNLDVKKFGIGTHIAKDLIIILFFIYCTFYIHSDWLKVAIFTLCFYWVNDIVLNLIPIKYSFIPIHEEKFPALIEILISSLTILILVFVTFNKFCGYTF